MIEKIGYTAAALATGAGRNGHVRSDDGRIDLELAVPAGMGGSGESASPEQLFASGYAACFHSAMQTVARAEGGTHRLLGGSPRAHRL